MYDAICTLPLTSDLFAQAIHPTEPLIAVGLTSGHVEALRLPRVHDEDDSGSSPKEDGCGEVATRWRTRRHKGSCRALSFGIDGESLISAGTDGIVKAASAETGQVVSKIAIPQDPSSHEIDSPSVLHMLSPQTLLLGTDSSAVHLYDLRQPSFLSTSQAPSQTHHPHDDYISSLTPLPPSDTSTSGYSKQWVTTGGSTLAVTDLRRGVLVKSEDQEEELLSSIMVSGLPAKAGRSKGEKVLVGGAGGVLTLWERGVWDDQDERIIVDRGLGGGESLDAMTLLPDGIGGPGRKHVAVGTGDGRIKFVRLGMNKVMIELRHDDVEGVVELGVDVGGRLISGGGQVIKIWRATGEAEESNGLIHSTGSTVIDSEGRSDSEAAEVSSEEEEATERKRRKKRKRNKSNDGGRHPHILGFSGLD
ncbi:MAG: WD repeat-containing protein jip5 [Caeruleum heppii]|nr:MAG: WD repeat-containing protein jip5 [Caeruleum heppii]